MPFDKNVFVPTPAKVELSSLFAGNRQPERECELTIKAEVALSISHLHDNNWSRSKPHTCTSIHSANASACGSESLLLCFGLTHTHSMQAFVNIMQSGKWCGGRRPLLLQVRTTRERDEPPLDPIWLPQSTKRAKTR
jgi:hypothetical protein